MIGGQCTMEVARAATNKPFAVNLPCLLVKKPVTWPLLQSVSLLHTQSFTVASGNAIDCPVSPNQPAQTSPLIVFFLAHAL